MQRVDSLQNFQYTEVDGDELIIDDLYRSDELTADMSALKHRALTHADIQLKLLSPDANVTGISLTLHLPEGSTSAASLEAVEAARTMLQPLRADFPEFMIELGGSATSNVTMGEAIGQDIRSLLLILIIAKGISSGKLAHHFENFAQHNFYSHNNPLGRALLCCVWWG